MRYISGGKDAQLERFTNPIKFVTAERNAVPKAARNIPPPLAGILKKKLQMRIISNLIFITILISCNSQPQKDSIDLNKLKMPEDQFADSFNIAQNRAFKIEINQFRDSIEGVYFEFHLFKQQKESTWQKKQSFKMQKDGITPLDVVFSDFNNDGLRDITIQSGVAARGANEIKSLFIFDKNNEEFKQITNSSNYPNLSYNSELNCIDAWLIYGGSTTLFLRLESDSLREFAGVDFFENRITSYEINSSGIKQIIEEREIISSDNYYRFKNYKSIDYSDIQNKNAR